MLKAIRLPLEEDGSWWTISPFSGSLIQHKQKPLSEFDKVPTRVKEALSYCEAPYTCKWTHLKSSVASELNDKKVQRVTTYHNRLLAITNSRFLLSRLYASFSQVMVETTYQAMGVISEIPEQVQNREERCLQRSLLAAKISASFYDDGVLFIGATTTSADMHAWIIEAGSQPDHEDRGWVNYRPLLALIKS